MAIEWANSVVFLLLGYVGLGLLVAPLVVFWGAPRFDSAVSGSSRGFRLIVIPGVVLLWPILVFRSIRGGGESPIESNAHRRAAREAAPLQGAPRS